MADWDRRCHVCWNRVYALWIDEGQPQTCPFGHTKAHECPDAMAAAHNSAMMIKALAAAQEMEHG